MITSALPVDRIKLTLREGTTGAGANIACPRHPPVDVPEGRATSACVLTSLHRPVGVPEGRATLARVLTSLRLLSTFLKAALRRRASLRH